MWKLFSTDANLALPPQGSLRCSKLLLRCRGTTQSYVGHLIRIGDTTLTLSVAEIVMRSPSDQRPGTGADIVTRH